MEGYWEATNGHAPHPVKYESEASVTGFPYCNDPGLNFSTTAVYSEDDTDFTPGRRGKTSRQDPLSHRIIEKRRRDRMNSCLADLSRLIPQQYMRKGRGRVEKTEIIEMAIRHLKNLQNQECINREVSCAEQFRSGYHECLTEAGKFTLRELGNEMYYRMISHLNDHCNDIMKEFSKVRCNVDNVSASSGSPSAYRHVPPTSQLRDILTTSDMEHSNTSNDHHDVKDLSFRTNPPQTPVITSTASVHTLDTSNNNTSDYERSSPSHLTTNNIINHLNNTSHNHHQSQHQQQDSIISSQNSDSVLRTVRMRKFSETSTDIEHNHNSYKFKNYIQQRFSQDNFINHHPSLAHQHMNGAGGNGNGIVNGGIGNAGVVNHVEESGGDIASEKNGIIKNAIDKSLSDVKRIKLTNGNAVDNNNSSVAINNNDDCNGVDGKILALKNGMSYIKNEILTTTATPNNNNSSNNNTNNNNSINNNNNSNSQLNIRHIPIPIFACHQQGFYIPLNIDYEKLIPYLGGIDLINPKNISHLPNIPLHPVNINVCYRTPIMKQLHDFNKNKLENLCNGW